VNPARSLGVAWFAGGAALAQMWLFIVGPIIGAAIAGATYKLITGAPSRDVGVAQNPEVEERQRTA
jgi:aquaporin Z